MNRLAWILGFVIAFLLALAFFALAPAQSHTNEQLDEWVEDWQSDAVETIEWFDDWTDMATRHLQFFGRHVHRAVSRQTLTAKWSVGVPAGVEQWRSLVASWFRADEVDRAMRIMSCESGGDPGAYNPSGASGLFQHLRKYWTSRSTAAGFPGADPFDPVANVATAAWLRDDMGWGSWVCR